MIGSWITYGFNFTSLNLVSCFMFQFPCAFEFNELFLITVLDHLTRYEYFTSNFTGLSPFRIQFDQLTFMACYLFISQLFIRYFLVQLGVPKSERGKG